MLALSRALSDVRPDDEGKPRAFLGAPSWRVRLEAGLRLAPWQASFLLGDIVGCQDFGRYEKLAWEYGLRFEGVPMTLALQKFGLRAYVDTQVDEPTAEQLAVRLAATLSRAMPLVEKTVLAEIADEQVARGEVNIDNRFGALDRQYQHFKRLAKGSLLAASNAKPIREELPGPSTGFTTRFPEFELREQARFETNAAVHAFFSLLEHLLLIAFLLSGEDATGGRLATFIGAGWNEKFKRMVDIRISDAKAYYDRIAVLHDELRNPSAHGEVNSDGTDFLFILPGVGPVPGRLVMRNGGRRTYRWNHGGPDDILGELTEVEGWLRSGPLAAAVAYGDSELQLFFGGDIREQLVVARGAHEDLAKMIDRLSWLVDRNANMDW